MMDRFITSAVSNSRRDSLVFSRSFRVPETPYEKLLSSITFEGRYTVASPRTSTRGRRVLKLSRENLPSQNLLSRLYDVAKEETHINLTGWLQENTDPSTDPINIESHKILEAPDLEDDYYLSLLDWSSYTNSIAIGLQGKIFAWNAVNELTTEIAEVPVGDSVASVAWMPGSTSLAVGTKNGRVELFDSQTGKSVRRFEGHCKYRTGVLSWNHSNNLLSSGGRDKIIYHHDHRTKDPISASVGHGQEVCGLKWDGSGNRLASGGNDNKVMIWDPRNLTSPGIVYDGHTAAVKALAWSPHVTGLLATGGGTADRTIRFWNTRLSGTDSLKSINANGQVCNMVWSPHSNSIVTTHGFSENQVLRWSYPLLQNTGLMMGHQQRVLHLCMSPDGTTVVTGSPDETLRFWKVFEEKPRGTRNESSRDRVYGMFSNPFD